SKSTWSPADIEGALTTATVVFQGATHNETSARAHLTLPAAAYAESDGTFTNFQGRVQRFRRALEPLGDALSGWQILARLGRALGLPDDLYKAERVEHVFTRLAATRPPFAGMTYRELGDVGRTVKA